MLLKTLCEQGRTNRERTARKVAYEQHVKLYTMKETWQELGDYIDAHRLLFILFLDVNGNKEAKKVLGHAMDYTEYNGRVLAQLMW